MIRRERTSTAWAVIWCTDCAWTAMAFGEESEAILGDEHHATHQQGGRERLAPSERKRRERERQAAGDARRQAGPITDLAPVLRQLPSDREYSRAELVDVICAARPSISARTAKAYPAVLKRAGVLQHVRTGYYVITPLEEEAADAA